MPALRIAPQRHAPEPARAVQPQLDPLDTVAAVQPTDLVPLSTFTEPFDQDGLVVDGPLHPEQVEPTLEDYIRRIEQSAARLRAEQLGETLTAGTPTRRAALTAASGATPVAERGGTPPRRRRRKQPPKPWYRRRRTWFLAAFIIPLVLVVVATAYVLNIVRLSVGAYNKINEEPVEYVRWSVNEEGTPVPVPSEEVEAVAPDWEGDEPVNIMLLGVDAQTADDQPPRSDTAIVVQVDPVDKSVSMMSIPRDLIVWIPGVGDDKFNAAFPIGELNEGDDVEAGQIPGGGPTLVAQTIGANFNIQIHYYVTIDFDGFERVVDTVGGVIVDVDNQLTDNQYPTRDLRLTRVYFPSGLQKLDGKAALEYVRTRHADSDFGRAERQQQVLLAIREQATALDLFTNAESLLREMEDMVRTDLNFNHMLALANLGRQVNEQDIARLNLWSEGLLSEHLPEFEGDGYYLSADWALVLERTAAFFSSNTAVAESDVTAQPGDQSENPDLAVPIFVENATDIPQLAGNSAQILVDAGYQAVWPSDAIESHATSVIETSDAEMATARHIADLLGLPGTAIVTVSGMDGITVILGGDVPDALLPASEELAG
jgi:LCP family protein required for cell wall assembly